MKDEKKLNNLLSMEEMTADKVFGKKAKTTKRTDVGKDVLQENAYVVGKEVFKSNPKVETPTGKGETVKVVGKEVLGDHLKGKEFHAAKGLNNLICLDDFTKSVPDIKDTPTKRTGTAKDVLKEAAYVLGKDVLNGEKLKNEQKPSGTFSSKGLNNLINLDDFTKNVPTTGSKATKRTEVAKDILLEKKKKEACKKEEEECEETSGLTAKQKKLPLSFQKAILKRQGKK